MKITYWKEWLIYHFTYHFSIIQLISRIPLWDDPQKRREMPNWTLGGKVVLSLYPAKWYNLNFYDLHKFHSTNLWAYHIFTCERGATMLIIVMKPSSVNNLAASLTKWTKEERWWGWPKSNSLQSPPLIFFPSSCLTGLPLFFSIWVSSLEIEDFPDFAKPAQLLIISVT